MRRKLNLKHVMVETKGINFILAASEMIQAKIENEFIVAALKGAFEIEAIGELMSLWVDEKDIDQKNEIIADISELLEDLEQNRKVEAPIVKFDELEKMSSDVMNFKDRLRLLVEEKGGIGNLAKLTGIPQPSLSRFFSSSSMPRRVTLLKIARALGLNDSQIVSEWVV